MPRKTNRQELIISKASELFMAQGYTSTSIRQIAEASGCTEAALYYHFREGKRALFQAVLESNLPNFLAMLAPCQNAASLQELILKIGANLELTADLWVRINWLLSEFPHLSSDEKKQVHQAYQAFSRELARLIRPFVASELLAQQIAWLVICAFFGYVQTFILMEMFTIVPISFEQFKVSLAQRFNVVAGSPGKFLE